MYDEIIKLENELESCYFEYVQDKIDNPDHQPVDYYSIITQ